ncbi:MAG: DNA repair protein RecN [Actinomycetota bacterium]
MLVELAVRDLGVIEEVRLLLGPGMTALTGETGAGKTLVVDAIELLVGGRADPSMVRSGAAEAWVEGRFLLASPDGANGQGDTEVVLARAIPAQGRSRAYVDGRLATIASLVEWGDRLIDLHGQHAHQSLLAPAIQRGALDRFAGVDLGPLREARGRVRDIDAQLAALGGDARARAREIDLLRFQVDELRSAAISGPDEDDDLDREENLLAEAVAHQAAAAGAVEALSADGGASDALGTAIAALGERLPFADAAARLRAISAELSDVAVEVRTTSESISDDPERLEAVRARRHALHDLRRKYGDTIESVLAYADDAASRLADLERHDEMAEQLDAERAAALERVRAASQAVAKERRAAAPDLAAAVEAHLGALAMARAQIEVAVAGEPPADDVAILLAANPGTDALPLAKVASGGELARTMLALRLVLTAGPPTLVFDEVDAGIGGEAAVAVGRSLGALGSDHQVLVVTHLPQVASFAHAHVRVTKETSQDRTVARAEQLDDAGRVVELSRMLSGQPGSRTAQEHASELLATASRERGVVS